MSGIIQFTKYALLASFNQFKSLFSFLRPASLFRFIRGFIRYWAYEMLPNMNGHTSVYPRTKYEIYAYYWHLSKKEIEQLENQQTQP